MITRLVLTAAVREALFAHARQGRTERQPPTDGQGEQPEPVRDQQPARREVCGVLGGDRRPIPDESAVGESELTGDERELIGEEREPTDETPERAIVTDCVRVPNVASDPRFRYELDPAATVEAIESLETDGLDHVGFYHTHPRGPRGPSRTDRARATWPGYIYLIVSLADDPVIGAWRWTGDAFVQLPIDSRDGTDNR